MELLSLGILLIFALGIIILLTRGVFARDLTRALKRVNQQEQQLQEQAEILEQRISQMERDYQAKLRHADLEAQRMLQEAKQQAMNIRTAAIEEAKHRARQLLLEAEQDKVQLRSELARELNGQAVQRACLSLRTLLPPQELRVMHETLVKELLEALKQLDVGPLRTGVVRVAVATGQPLAESEVQQLAQWAASAVGEDIPVHVETDPALVAGCIVRLGTTIVDNSLPNRLGQR